MRQRWRLADIRAEEVAFVLLSSYLNHLDAQASLRNFFRVLRDTLQGTGAAGACLAWASAGSCSRSEHLRSSRLPCLERTAWARAPAHEPRGFC